MTAGYQPDEWLGILASSKIYVDFPKLEFDSAYTRLKCIINQHRPLDVKNKQHDETENQLLKTAMQAHASHTITSVSSYSSQPISVYEIRPLTMW